MDYQFKTEPFSHQRDTFLQTQHEQGWAIFWEQGTGKTKLAIDTASFLFLQNYIDGVLVIAPNGVHENWVTDEIPEHMPDAVRARCRPFAYHSGKAGTKYHQRELAECLRGDLPFLCMSYDGFMTDEGKKLAKKFLTTRRVMVILDESGRIKNPSAKRTRTMLKAGVYAHYRRILDGTPVANGPFDVYAPMKFLDPDFWKPFHLDSFTVFKHHFGIWKKAENAEGREFEWCVGYRHLDELEQILKVRSSRVLKDDVLDLPPKLYSKLTFDLSPAQRKIYNQLRDEFVAWLDAHKPEPCAVCGGHGLLNPEAEGDDQLLCVPCDGTGMSRTMISANLTITRMLRLQQVACGYVPEDDGGPIHLIGKDNPRLDLTMEKLQDIPHKAIVWARFSKDIDLIMEECKRLKLEAVRYDGKVDQDERLANRQAFQRTDSGPQFFVANPAAAATGLTFVAAKTNVYYSNSFKLIERLQSEDRTHRIGQTSSVNYLDMIARDTIDERLVSSLRTKKTIASLIMGDAIKEWI